MRLAFMGTPDFAVTALDALVTAGHVVAAVYTQPPRPGNRGRLTATPVQRRAEALGLPVRTPARLRDQPAQVEFAALDLDLAVVAAYGLILPRAILDAPRHGCINIHASLLPRWRGAAPVQRAILAGDAATGVTLMQMDSGLDTGAMLAQATLPIDRLTAGEVTDRLARLGAGMLIDLLPNLATVAAQPQPAEGITYAQKIDKAESRIAWTQGAADIERLVRAMQPGPGAWFLAEGQRVKLIAAETGVAAAAPGTVLPEGWIACGTDALRPLVVQPAGKGVMAAVDWWRGRRLRPGDPLE